MSGDDVARMIDRSFVVRFLESTSSLVLTCFIALSLGFKAFYVLQWPMKTLRYR